MAGSTAATLVRAENARPGTADWKLSGTDTGGISGYADAVDAIMGQTVTLYVSTKAPSFTVQAYRMGYYGGAGGRLVWQSGAQRGERQPACPTTPGINMVQCRWKASATFTVDSAWVQGEYLIKLIGGRGQSYVPLTVWDPGSKADIVIMDGSFTDQVFNAYGGADLYQGQTPCAPRTYPCSTRARVVSFDRPYLGRGDGGFLALTYPLTRLAEQHGLDVTYWTDLTLARYGRLLSRHKVLVSPGHDEEWSLSMRRAADSAVTTGVNLAFFGASPGLRKIRLQPSPLGPDRQVVNYRDPQADPFYTTNRAEVSQNSWDTPPASLPSSVLAGATYIGYNNHQSFPLEVTDPTSWLFTGTGLKAGDNVPGVEFADFQEVQGSPARQHVRIQAHSPVIVELHGRRYADTSYYTNVSHAGVWQSGTNGWIPALGLCTANQACTGRLVQQMTLNVLRTLGAGPLGLSHPS